MYLALQNIPSALVLTFGNKVLSFFFFFLFFWGGGGGGGGGGRGLSSSSSFSFFFSTVANIQSIFFLIMSLWHAVPPLFRSLIDNYLPYIQFHLEFWTHMQI